MDVADYIFRSRYAHTLLSTTKYVGGIYFSVRYSAFSRAVRSARGF